LVCFFLAVSAEALGASGADDDICAVVAIENMVFEVEEAEPASSLCNEE